MSLQDIQFTIVSSPILLSEIQKYKLVVSPFDIPDYLFECLNNGSDLLRAKLGDISNLNYDELAPVSKIANLKSESFACDSDFTKWNINYGPRLFLENVIRFESCLDRVSYSSKKGKYEPVVIKIYRLFVVFPQFVPFFFREDGSYSVIPGFNYLQQLKLNEEGLTKCDVNIDMNGNVSGVAYIPHVHVCNCSCISSRFCMSCLEKYCTQCITNGLYGDLSKCVYCGFMCYGDNQVWMHVYK